MQSDPKIDLVVHAAIDVLREHREAAGISKKQLSEKSGVTRTAIILMERYERSPSLELLYRISSALGVTLSSVIEEAETRSAKRRR